TGVRAIVSTPPMPISIAITMNVYGRRRARRTIHIAQPLVALPSDTLEPDATPMPGRSVRAAARREAGRGARADGAARTAEISAHPRAVSTAAGARAGGIGQKNECSAVREPPIVCTARSVTA